MKTEQIAEIVKIKAAELRSRLGRRARLMEVCGTHTAELFRSGVRSLLAEDVEFISGPGCPVCVTPVETVDRAIALAAHEKAVVCTFGDMFRVPGSGGTLAATKAAGADIRIVYSPLDALKIADAEPERNTVFLGVGFETTTPAVAAVIQRAARGGKENFAVLCAHKLIPPAMTALLEDREINIDGFICPGHVSVITGSRAYAGIARDYGVPCVITGFEARDLLAGVMMLARQVVEDRADVEVQYTRAVRAEGNARARRLIREVFEPADTEWRGLGALPGGGLAVRAEYREFDAAARWPVDVAASREPHGCRCADVLRGKITPSDCPLFAGSCRPGRPVGACMVSSEGACSTYYRFGEGGEGL